MPPSPHDAEYGRYKIRVVGKEVKIFARDDESTIHVPQSIQIKDLRDLHDLFTVIGTVLHEIRNDNQ